MRLINIHTLELHEFAVNPPRYIILSHRWTDDEPSYKDFAKRRRLDSTGGKKIVSFCTYVQKQTWDGNIFSHLRHKPVVPVEWVWIDTVCIDKRSSSELSEAINSMWSWYRNADRCIAYLSDVHKTGTMLDNWYQFNRSEWFTRGWTLQELLAPTAVTFCDSEWNTMGTLSSGFRWDTSAIIQHVCLASGIDITYLQGDHSHRSKAIANACVAQKLKWAARRKTTRPEDMAYCLLGLLEVNMPLLYGEGGHRAFIRLQQEIIKQSDDESIFAWQRSSLLDEPFGILAPDIRYFRHTTKAETIPANELGVQYKAPYSVTNKGIQMEAVAYPVLSTTSSTNTRQISTSSVDQRLAVPLVIVEEPEEDSKNDQERRKQPIYVHFPSEQPQTTTTGTEGRFLIRLNCSSVDLTSEKLNERRRCAIVVRRGADGIATRVMAGSLHSADFLSLGDPVTRNFIVKLTSTY